MTHSDHPLIEEGLGKVSDPGTVEIIREGLARKKEEVTNMADRIEWLRGILDDFGPPFLPEGFVDVFCTTQRMHIHIGDRDVELLLETGEITAAGTNVGPGREWEIRHRDQADLGEEGKSDDTC